MSSTSRTTKVREKAREELAKSDSTLTRDEAIRLAISLGVPLHKIEQYLDWIEMVEQSESTGGVPDRPHPNK